MKSAKASMENWLLCTPLPYDPAEPNWWKRNAGPLVLALQDRGINARLLTLGPPGEATDRPHVQADMKQLADPEWWRSQRAGVVGWGGGTNPRLLPVTRAALASGAKLFQMLDSDGMISPSGSWERFFSWTRGTARDSGKALPWVRALAKCVYYAANPRAPLRHLTEHLEGATGTLVVTPLAAQRLRSFLLDNGRNDLAERVQFLPHPVTEDMRPSGNPNRPRRVTAIGRWNSYAKNAPLLMAVLKEALIRRPDYSADIIGPGSEILQKLISNWPTGVRDRVELPGPVLHDKLAERLRDARISLVTSRWESFHIAAAESLCCGCSVVGPAMIPSIPYFASQQSGIAAGLYTADDLANSLLLEMDAWETGQRDPEAIGKIWGKELHTPHVTDKMMRIVASSPA